MDFLLYRLYELIYSTRLLEFWKMHSLTKKSSRRAVGVGRMLVPRASYLDAVNTGKSVRGSGKLGYGRPIASEWSNSDS